MVVQKSPSHPHAFVMPSDDTNIADRSKSNIFSAVSAEFRVPTQLLAKGQNSENKSKRFKEDTPTVGRRPFDAERSVHSRWLGRKGGKQRYFASKRDLCTAPSYRLPAPV